MKSVHIDIGNVSQLANRKRRGSDRRVTGVGAQPLHWLVPCQAKAKQLLTSFHFPSVRQLSAGHALTYSTKMYDVKLIQLFLKLVHLSDTVKYRAVCYKHFILLVLLSLVSTLAKRPFLVLFQGLRWSHLKHIKWGKNMQELCQ